MSIMKSVRNIQGHSFRLLTVFPKVVIWVTQRYTYLVRSAEQRNPTHPAMPSLMSRPPWPATLSFLALTYIPQCLILTCNPRVSHPDLQPECVLR